MMYGMTGEQIRAGVTGSAAATAVLLAILMLRLAVYHPEQVVLRAYEQLGGFLQQKQQDSDWYRRRSRMLEREGAAFHFGRWVNPGRLLLLQVVLAACGLLTGVRISTGAGLLAAVVLFVLPVGFVHYFNSRDNIAMLSEIKLIYHALELQIKAGVYMTDALAECYGSVHHKRLRQGLLDLAGDIVMKADVYEALERFQGRFNNRYIDTLVITLLQALESGQAVELLGDIAEQIKDMETTVLDRRKGNLDRSLTMYQLGVLASVLGIVLYACVQHMFASVIYF